MKRMLSTLAVLAAALPFGAAAQEQKEAERAAAGVQSRMIGDWAFVPVTVVQGPYVSSFASSTTGIGGYTLDLELELPPGLTPRTQDLTYIALLQRFDAQLAFLRRFALRATFQGEAIAPDTGSSAFSLVLNGTWAVGGGLVAQIIATDRLMFSLTADYRRAQRSLLSPATSVEQADPERGFGALLTRQDIDAAEAGGSLAIAFAEWAGLVAEANWEGDWPEPVGPFHNEPDSYHFVDVSGALSVNFWKRRFPVGVTGFWRERIPVGERNPYVFSRQYGGGVFYTGRPYLDVGVELLGDSSDQEAGNTLRRTRRLYVAPRIRGYF